MSDLERRCCDCVVIAGNILFPDMPATNSLRTTVGARCFPLLSFLTDFSLSYIIDFRVTARLLKSSAPATGDEVSGGQARLEAIEEEETVRMHLTALKREEVALQV